MQLYVILNVHSPSYSDRRIDLDTKRGSLILGAFSARCQIRLSLLAEVSLNF